MGLETDLSGTTFNAGPAPADGDTDTASAVGLSLFLWGGQFEEGAYPTSYIPTAGSSVARNADLITSTTVDWFTSTAGTFYVEGRFPFVSAAARAILTLDDGGTTDRFFLELDAAENVNWQTTHNSDTDGASDGAGVIAADTTFRVAGAFADDDVRAAVDGTLSPADTAAAIPLGDAPTTLRIGGDSGTIQFNGHIAEVRYYNVRKADTILQDLSNGLVKELGSLDFARVAARTLARDLARQY